MTNVIDCSSSRAFWDATFGEQTNLPLIDPDSYHCNQGLTHREFCNRLGDVRGLNVLDIGCGGGKLSVYLALRGAHVTATDFSSSAISKTRQLAQANRVRVHTRQIDAMDLADLGQKFDLVTGRYVLHHIEPFDKFVDVIDRFLHRGGRGVFFENNSRNAAIMFARKHLAGRMGIPRYGDDEEHPLMPEEVDYLRQTFGSVHQHYPELYMLRKLNVYVLKGRKFSALRQFNRWADNRIGKAFPALRCYSYVQVIEFTK